MTNFNLAQFAKRMGGMPEFKKGELTPVQMLLKKRLELGLSREKISRLLECPTMSLRRWERQEHKPSPVYEKKIFQLLNLIEKLEKKSQKKG